MALASYARVPIGAPRAILVTAHGYADYGTMFADEFLPLVEAHKLGAQRRL